MGASTAAASLRALIAPVRQRAKGGLAEEKRAGKGQARGSGGIHLLLWRETQRQGGGAKTWRKTLDQHQGRDPGACPS
ncbi:hypothetical protein RSK20926_12619 [Roseobacter sp. SK209-2-6]|nr:hypothetical protein RSK20926_12619 [Roseobacter sp. SK209-2-6]